MRRDDHDTARRPLIGALALFLGIGLLFLILLDVAGGAGVPTDRAVFVGPTGIPVNPGRVMI
jgi:hypothetical protein